MDIVFKPEANRAPVARQIPDSGESSNEGK
jgi:hypothetical protein